MIFPFKIILLFFFNNEWKKWRIEGAVAQFERLVSVLFQIRHALWDVNTRVGRRLSQLRRHLCTRITAAWVGPKSQWERANLTLASFQVETDLGYLG